MLFKPYERTGFHWLRLLSLGLWKQGMVPANKAKIGHVLGEEIPERLLKPGEISREIGARISAMASDPELLTQVRSAVQLLLRKNEESVIAFLQPRVEQSLLAALDRNLTPENLDGEHLCCIIRSKKAHPGVEAKRQWLADRLKEGHIFRKLNAKATVFIEYAPLETAWTPVLGDSYYYIYCLWVCGESKGKGYGRALMEYCLADARAKGKSGVCMLGAEKQKAWLSDQAFAKKFGFQTVDTAPNGYELLALSFDGTKPRFAPHAKKQQIENKELTVFYDMQCPYILQRVERVERYCGANGVPLSLVRVDTLQKAKELPCVFNNWAVFYKGKFETVNLLDDAALQRLLKK